MQLDRRVLYFPAITLTALTLTLTVVMIISTYRNLHREREQMIQSLTHEGTALLRQFEIVAHHYGGGLPAEIAEVQRLAEAVAPNDEIVYLYLFDTHGLILAHSEPERIGQFIEGPIPAPDETLKFKREDASEHVFEIRRAFHPFPRPLPQTHYLGIGLRMAALERIHEADRKHTMMMTTILILLGSASLFFIIVVQNFYLVQRTLERMRSYIHYVVESMANGLISLDAEGVVTTINPAAAELMGIPIEEARGLSYRDLFPEQAERIQQVLAEDASILNQEVHYTRTDGVQIPMSLNATQVKDNGGNRLGAVLVLHDLRQVKALQERAQRAEHLASIGRLAATVAHEIRNPLSSIRGFAQYFATLFQEEGDERAYARAMVEESDRLNRVVSELLSYARPLELNIETYEVEKLLLDTIQRVQPEATHKGIEITSVVEPDIPPIRGDPHRMLQVLLNLVQNSLAAMSEGDRLTLGVTWLSEHHALQITVEDTGSGIPKDHLPKLFEPFFTTKERGTGLGLALVRKIIDAHQGTIRVRSEPGRGTRFTLILPQTKGGSPSA